jgi:metal-sulfur cluster biosynthetic enzyme
MVTEETVRSALESVVYPSFGLSIVTLEMVRDVRVSQAGIEVDMVMNCPGCPAGEATLAEVQRTIHSLLPSGSGVVRIQLLSLAWTPPWEAFL